MTEASAAAAALGPEPSGMFGDLEEWAGDDKQGDASLPEHDSSEVWPAQTARCLCACVSSGVVSGVGLGALRAELASFGD